MWDVIWNKGWPSPRAVGLTAVLGTPVGLCAVTGFRPASRVPSASWAFELLRWCANGAEGEDSAVQHGSEEAVGRMRAGEGDSSAYWGSHVWAHPSAHEGSPGAHAEVALR